MLTSTPYSRWLARCASPTVLWICAVTFTCVLLWFQLPFGQPGSISAVKNTANGLGILNVRPYYDATTAYQHLHAYIPEGRWHVLAILVLDVLLLIPTYTVLLGGIMVRLQYRKPHTAPSLWHRMALHLPLLAGGCNLLEDALMAALIFALPDIHSTWATIMGLFTTTKTVALWGALLAVVFMVLSRTRRFNR